MLPMLNKRQANEQIRDTLRHMEVTPFKGVVYKNESAKKKQYTKRQRKSQDMRTVTSKF